jgi:hypothetical protein
VTDPRPLRAGRPRVIKGTSVRHWLYVSAESRDAAAQRAEREGTNLPTVLRAYLDAYAAGSIPAAPQETS